MRLSRFLRADLVIPDFSAEDVKGAIRSVSSHLEARGAVDSAESVERALLERERAHSTALGHGMALPHATIPGLERPVLLVALARSPIDFGPSEADPVTLLFVLLSPPGQESQHIKLLARICRLVRDPAFVEALLAAKSGEEAVQAIERVDEQHV